MQYGGGPQAQVYIPQFKGVVRVLVLACVGTFILQALVDRFSSVALSTYFGFAPGMLLAGWLWQPFTYAFLHAGIFHLLFNMLILWSIGSELEDTWGTRFFSVYFMACSVGAAIFYALFTIIGIGGGPLIPVVGCSGAVYGLLLAYGILFGDRVLHFMMIFPMKAKYFVMILGGIALFASLLSPNGGVAHAAHLGGLIAGFAILYFVTAWRRREGLAKQRKESRQREKRLKSNKHLRLVDSEEDESPKVWH